MKLIKLSFTILLLQTPWLCRADIGHELSFGGGISLMNVTEAGVGYGANVGYRVAPILPIPLGVALDISALRWDTAKTGDGNTNLFAENRFATAYPTSLSLISFIIRVDYRVVDERLWFLSPAVGWGNAISAETRRDATPSSAGLDPNTTDTQLRMLFSVGADLGFKMTSASHLVIRPQMYFIKERNFVSPMIILATNL